MTHQKNKSKKKLQNYCWKILLENFKGSLDMAKAAIRFEIENELSINKESLK